MSTLIDVLGNVDEDGSGTAREHTDNWTYRLDSPSSPSETFNAEEWHIQQTEDIWLYSLYWSSWLWTDMENFPMLYNVSTGSYIDYLILSDEEAVYLFIQFSPSRSSGLISQTESVCSADVGAAFRRNVP